MSLPGGYALTPGQMWTDLAATWPVVTVSRETEPGHFLTDVVPVEPTGPLTQIHLTCAACGGNPSAFCLSADTEGPGYTVTLADLLAGILAHIRRSHPDVVAS
jgi:hypothetical protein